MIAALADPHFARCASALERYQQKLQAEARRVIQLAARKAAKEEDRAKHEALLSAANREVEKLAREQTGKLLGDVLYESSCGMKNAFARSDA